MTHEPRPAILAVDGGNSKTDVLAVAADGAVLAHARGPGFRPQHTGLTAAVDDLARTVAQVLDPAAPGPSDDRPDAARAEGGRVEVLAAFLAGVDLPEEEEALRRELRARGWARRVEAGNDTLALLRAGTEAGWGVAVVCGHGINAIGVAPDGRRAWFPALGPITGDWGGGQQLGEEALWHAVRAEDGRGPATALTSAVAAHFGTATALDVGLGIHRGDLAKVRLGELAPAVCAAAEADDPAACLIVDRLAAEVTAFARAALTRLGLLDAPADVVLGGGVLAADHPRLTTGVRDLLRTAAPYARPHVVAAPPVLGAALLGLDALPAATPGAGVRVRTEVRVG